MSETMVAPGRRPRVIAGGRGGLRVVPAEPAVPPTGVEPWWIEAVEESPPATSVRPRTPASPGDGDLADGDDLLGDARAAGEPAVGRRAVAARREPAPLRITRRGRLVVVLVVSVILCVAFSLGRVTSSASTGPVHHRTVVVQPGDTLWSVAHRAAPGKDTRVEVEQISQLNHLDDGVVEAGAQLQLP